MRLLAGRFSVEDRIAAGGMGTVHRGTDVTSGITVAIKLLRVIEDEPRARLAREAKTLSEIGHPNVVRYVAHGVSDEGEPFLAMEWIEGETLRDRLGRAPLSTSEAIEVGRTIARALAHIHALGLVHRDIKPANVILRDGRIDGATLVDFGLVRMPAEESLARTGTILGTPAYMAPEQARGDHTIGPGADVFALGCVLYRCITGRNAFEALDGLAVLAKVLLDDPLRPSEIVSGLEPRVEAAVLRMLSKDVERRFTDGADAVRALDALGTVKDVEPSTTTTTRVGVDERRLRTVVLAATSIDRDATMGRDDPLAAVRTVVERVGDARCEVVASGAVVVTVLGTDSPKERALKAAACAIELRELLGVPLAIATGHTVALGGPRASQPPTVSPDVFDRAAKLLRDASGKRIVVDDTTATLLAERYAVSADHELVHLVDDDSARTFLGRSIAFVGREREMVTIQAVLAESERESTARVVLVTGPPGIGKSRLRRETMARCRGRALVLVGSGDALHRGAPWSTVARAFSTLIAAVPSERPSAKAARLAARIRQAVNEEADRVSEFLSELCFPELDVGPPSARRLAARADPVLMHDLVSRAFCDWLDAECARQPVVLVLEDLQWVDALSLRLVDTALGALADRPFTVLAFARPEIAEVAPNLWASRGTIPIALGVLSKRASESFVRNALESANAETVERIVRRSGGNPLYLEELVRAERAGRGANPPDTVLAMVESRLGELDPDLRRVLRAASLFEGSFDSAAVRAVLSDEDPHRIETHLRDLVTREILVAAHGQTVFRDALIRDAAYGTFTEDDARVGHRLAARWFDSKPDADPIVVAEHHARSDQPANAIDPLLRCAQIALDASDFGAALVFADRARSLGATTRSALVESEANRWLGRTAKAHAAALEAVRDPSEPHRLAALRALAYCARELGLASELLGVFDALVDHAPSRAWVFAATQTATSLAIIGKLEQARRLIDLCEPHVTDAALRARFLEACVACASHAGDLEALLDLVRKARDNALEAHDRRSAIVQTVNEGFALMQLGDYEGALESFEGARLESESLGLVANRRSAMQNAGYVLFRLGRIDEARAMERAVLHEIGRESSPRLLTLANACLALIELEAGNVERAQEHAEAALAAATGRPQEAYAETALAEVWLAADPARALSHANRALEGMRSIGAWHFAETSARIARATALKALGREKEAGEAIRAAKARIADRAAKLSPERRATFLERVRENRRVASLSAE